MGVGGRIGGRPLLHGAQSRPAEAPRSREPAGARLEGDHELPKSVSDDRFGLVRDQGLSREFLGCTGSVHGGGFLCTNYDSLSAGLVLHLGSRCGSCATVARSP